MDSYTTLNSIPHPGSQHSPSPQNGSQANRFSKSTPLQELDGAITWRESQAKTRLKVERSIEMLKSIDLPGQSHAIRYLEHLYRRHCKLGTIENARIVVFYFLVFLKTIGCQHLEEISRNDLSAFAEQEQDRGLKPTSVRLKIQTLYAFFRFLEPDNIINPDILARKIKIRLPQSLPKAIAAQDVARLFSVISNTRDRALMLVLLRTGMRIGELLNRMVYDVDFQSRIIKIYEGEKNSIGRVVYLSDDALQVLKEWYNTRNPSKAYLFYGLYGPLGYTAARNLFVKYRNKAGLAHKGYTLHCLRHTFATDLLNAGMRLECLQQLLGHAKIDVTRIYAKLSDQTREEEYFRAMAKIERGSAHGY